MITVFYDGKCGLCSREIEYYKSVAPSGIFFWQDITKDDSGIEGLGISYADGLKLLHARDEQGRLYVGVDAFLLIWRQMRRWRMLAAVVDFPLVRPLANAIYRAFAAWRFKRLSHCQLALMDADRKLPDRLNPAAISYRNVLGGELALHCHSPKTGFYRDGYCKTGETDTGSHVVAAIVTQAFLNFTRSRGNDLETPRPMYDFHGLKPGDSWCLCALRWKEAHEAGVAPPVVLEATHEKALKYISLEILKIYRAS